jgi:UBX domain-containing protein 7
VTRYQVNDFPHVAFIDPRTARLLWRKEGWTQENPLTAESFAEQAMDFCSRNSFDRPPAVPRPPGAKPPQVSQKRTVEAMTEDEQLEAAMQASIDDLAPAAVASPEINGVAHLDADEDTKPAATPSLATSSSSSSSQAVPSFLDEVLQLSVGDEPANGARLQIRMPDGAKIVRRFDASQSVKTIYAFVAVSLSNRILLPAVENIP